LVLCSKIQFPFQAFRALELPERLKGADDIARIAAAIKGLLRESLQSRMRLRNIKSHFYPPTSPFACRPRRLRHRSGAKSARPQPSTLRFPRSSKTCEPQSTICPTTHFYTLLRHTIASFARLIFCRPRYASSAVAILCYAAAAALSAVIWVPSLSPFPLQYEIFYIDYQLHVPLLTCNSPADAGTLTPRLA
jgi:hypothetical protein